MAGRELNYLEVGALRGLIRERLKARVQLAKIRREAARQFDIPESAVDPYLIEEHLGIAKSTQVDSIGRASPKRTRARGTERPPKRSGRKARRHEYVEGSPTGRFGNLLRRLRHEKHHTLDQLAKACGTHKGYISGIEKGKINPPSARVIRKFAEVLGFDQKTMLKLGFLEKAPMEIREELMEKVLGGADFLAPPVRNGSDIERAGAHQQAIQR